MNTTITGFILLIILPAIISSVIFCIKNHSIIKKSSNVFLLNVLVFFSFLSLVKSLLGECFITIIESFSENSLATYVHYSLPLLFVAIIVPLLYNQFLSLFHISTNLFPNIFISVFICSSILSYMLHSRIENIFIGFVLIISIILTLISRLKGIDI